MTDPEVVAGRRRLPEQAFKIKAAVAELRRGVRHQFGFGRIEYGDALAFDLGEKPRFFVPDDLRDANHLDRLATGAGAIHALDDPFGIPDKHPRSGRNCLLPCLFRTYCHGSAKYTPENIS